MINVISSRTVVFLASVLLVVFVAANATQAHSQTTDSETGTHAEIEVEARSESEVEAQDADDDGDGVDDADSAEVEVGAGASSANERAQSETEANARVNAIKEIDKSSPKVIERLGIDQSSPLLYQGVSVRVRENTCPEGETCVGNGEEARPDIAEIRVSGEDVRGWSEEQKEVVRQRLAAADEKNDANDFGIRVASAAVENENVVDIISDEEHTEITYDTRVRLFGFIPTSVRATAQARSNGEARVSYPWYAFLASKGEDRETFTSLVTELRSAHNAILSISVEEEGVERTLREDDSDESN